MTAHAGPMPVPARITQALDSIGAEGPDVDLACGTWEGNPAGDVDAWEAGEAVPTSVQIERLAAYTGRPPAYFYLPPADWESKPTRYFLCDMRRRVHGLTVVESHIGWDGVLQVRELTPPKPPYRPRKTTPEPRQEATMPARTSHTRRGRAVPHVPREDPDAPGCCATCHLPVAARNAAHVADPTDIPPARPGPQDRAAGDLED